jgi:acyl-coenzyme A thioesterase PaaI-like protein
MTSPTSTGDGARIDLDPHLFGAGQPCFGCSPDHPTGFRLRFAREGEAVTTRFTPTDAHQGPPRLMHGGLVMTLADEIGAWTLVGLLGKFGFTAKFAAKLRKPVRIGVETVGRGVIEKVGSRLVTVRVGLTQGAEEVFEADIAFVLVDEKAAESILGAPLPPAWRTFCRA